LEQYYLENVDQIKAIAEPTRWRMLHLLIRETLTGSQLARLLKIPRPLAHYHLKTLERTGLVALIEERAKNSVIEKYYRATAKQYLTDRLLDRERQMQGEGETAQQTVQAYSEVTRAMLELVNADVSQPDAFGVLLKIGFNFQEEIHLTLDEVKAFKQQLHGQVAELIALDHKNRETGSQEKLLHLRYTVFLNPAAAFDFDLPIEHDKTSHSLIEPDEKSLSIENH
jgi:DNA-binding transcriptional ArsR family regulator